MIKELQFEQRRNLEEISQLRSEEEKSRTRIVNLEKEVELCKINTEAMQKFQQMQNEVQKQKNKLQNFLESYNLINVVNVATHVCRTNCASRRRRTSSSAPSCSWRGPRSRSCSTSWTSKNPYSIILRLKSKELQTNQDNRILQDKVSFLNLEKEQFYQGETQQLKEDSKYQKLCEQIKHLTQSNLRVTEELNNTVKKYRKSEEEKYLLQKRMEEKLQSQNELNKIRKEVSMLQSLREQNEVGNEGG